MQRTPSKDLRQIGVFVPEVRFATAGCASVDISCQAAKKGALFLREIHRRSVGFRDQRGNEVLRVAIIHYWLVAERGGEKVVRALCDMFPQAVIFTHVADKDLTARLFPEHEIRETFIARLPFSKSKYQSYLPLMPLALEELDLSAFDLVISSESGPAKGVIPRPDAAHICYCHSPMRYIWDQYHLYRRGASWPVRQLMPAIAHRMRQWDVTSAARVDQFIANSDFVAQRIGKYYRRTAQVVHPPVDVDAFSTIERDTASAFADGYLWVGQLTSYKRPDLAVRAFTASGRKLFVIGEGENAGALKQIAGNNISFLGRADKQTLRDAYSSSRALIFPGEEDFGIVPVEAMAAGLPVIAYAKGGALGTVVDGETGYYFHDQTIESLNAAVEKFEANASALNPATIKRHAQRFSVDRFKMEMREAFRGAGVDL